MTRTSFHSENYRQRNHHADPVVTLKLHHGGKSYSLDAYVDTGTTCGLFLTKRQVEKLKLNLDNKINTDAEPATLADGKQIASDVYLCTLELSGKKEMVQVVVLDPKKRLDIKKEQVEPDDEPLLGREFLDQFDTLFSGIDGKLTLSR